MKTPQLLSVILPCRNQADHIGGVLQGYLDALSAGGLPFELVVVPNACTDHTAEVVSKIADRDQRVRIVENPKGGWGLSVRVGLNSAAGDLLCYTNTARTDPAILPAFVQRRLDHGPCLVKASRKKRAAPLREFGSMLYNLEALLLHGVRVNDVNGTPKVFSRDLFTAIPLSSDGDLLDLELIAKATRLRTRIVEIPTFGFSRHGGRSSTNLKSAWRMYAGALTLNTTLPLSRAS